jgi:diguanylate cyclase (GGDEF)-like protein
MRTADFLARYGGDELTLIIRDSGTEAAKTVTQKIIDLMAGYTFKLPGQNILINLGITAGIATYPLHAQSAGDLLRAADAALYHAKKHHRGSFVQAQNPTGPLSSVPVVRKSE